jgi:integrase
LKRFFGKCNVRQRLIFKTFLVAGLRESELVFLTFDRLHLDRRHQADFFCGRLKGITFPYSSGRIHFAAFFRKLLGTKNSMIVAINHPHL